MNKKNNLLNADKVSLFLYFYFQAQSEEKFDSHAVQFVATEAAKIASQGQKVN